jgi:alkylation response protein AidB-like acyl-CoA dehydrogenase
MFDWLLTDEEKKIKQEVRLFVKEKVPSRLIRDLDEGRLEHPREFIENAGGQNLLGLRFPKKWGGRGMNWVAEVAAIEEVGVLGTSLGCAYSMPSIVGEAVNRFGTDDQKERFLKPTLQGKLYSAEGLTEPRGGSDFFGTTSLARREGDGYLLNGQKRFVVGAQAADYFLVYAKTSPQAPPHEAISAFLVERGPGVTVQAVYGLMGTRGGGTGRLVFKDCYVPKENLVGRENGAYGIFNRMMVPERMTSAAGALGLARAALEVATRYSNRRKAFGKLIREFQAVSFMVADSITALDAARALVYIAARGVDSDLPDPRRMVSEAKKVATETAWTVVNNAMQVMGGIGYTTVYPIERLLRDCRLGIIWTGSNQIMNLLIQHEYYKEVLSAKEAVRDVEADALAPIEEEKVFE